MVSWLPLESNPDVMNKFMKNLGVPVSWQVTDVMGLDEPLLAMVPQPCAALILLYPLTDKVKAADAEEEAKLTSEGSNASSKVYYMKQVVRNACGTVALIHALANNKDRVGLSDGALKAFLDKTANMTIQERGDALGTDEGIANAHKASAQEGQTAAPSLEQEFDTHFIALVNVEGKLYELDGRKSAPITHGSTSNETLLPDAAKICQKFMARDPNETRFAVLALTAAE